MREIFGSTETAAIYAPPPARLRAGSRAMGRQGVVVVRETFVSTDTAALYAPPPIRPRAGSRGVGEQREGDVRVCDAGFEFWVGVSFEVSG